MSVERFEELLPWYVNGTIGAEDRIWFARYLQEHPEANDQLRWETSLRSQLKQDVPQMSEEFGLDKMMARIQALGKTQPPPRPSSHHATLFERGREWLASLAQRPALATALVVVVAQASVIGSLLDRSTDDTQLRALPPAADTPALPPAAHAPAEPGRLIKRGAPATYVRINFRPDAREADIRLLLVQVQGSLAAGPGQLGDYYLRVAPERREQALAQLRANAIVESAHSVDGLPGRD